MEQLEQQVVGSDLVSYRRRQGVYRDALAVQIEGLVREPVGNMGDVVDIVKILPDRVRIYEVKYGGTSMRSGLARVRSAGMRYVIPEEYSDLPIELWVHVVRSADRRQRAREYMRIEEHRQEWELDNIQLCEITAIELPEVYTIGDREFADRQEIKDYLQEIKADYDAYDGLGNQASDWLNHFVDYAMVRAVGCRLSRLTLSSYKGGLSIQAIGAGGKRWNPGTAELVRSYLERLHWRWVYGAGPSVPLPFDRRN
jgi:hypothetical protein